MEMERINENTIRVLIDSDDLQARGIHILDLLGNHQQIQDFFYSILKEVDSDRQFQDNDSVTFQVMPNNNGLELFISKNDPFADGDQPMDAITNYLQRSQTDRKPDDQPTTATPADQEEASTFDLPAEPLTKEVVAEFNSFEDLISFAKLVNDHQVVSELYKYGDKYYLSLRFLVTAEQTEADIKNHLALVYEYGNPTQLSTSFLGEHGKKLMEVSAIHLIQHYFG